MRPRIAVSDTAAVLWGAAGSPGLEGIGVCRGCVECRRSHLLQGVKCRDAVVVPSSCTLKIISLHLHERDERLSRL